MNSPRVLVVDDSPLIRQVWGKVISTQADMSVAGTAGDGVAALEFLKQKGADVVLLDIEMPNMDGLTALPLILKENPRTRVIIASTLTTKGSQTAIKALTLGASDYIAKPSSLEGGQSLEEAAKTLVEKIRALKPVTGSTGAYPGHFKKPVDFEKPSAIVIGSSTGGPNALSVVLKALPKTIQVPILLVQHMPPFFITALAQRLGDDTGRPCKEAVTQEPVLPGRIYVAPGNFHMFVEGTAEQPKISLLQGPHENFCRPAVDPLFRSAAEVFGKKLLAVVLTGMGEDGRAGCEQVIKRGGGVIAQDERSSVVWGMPGAVTKAGLASSVITLSEIAPFVEQVFAKGRV